MSNTRKTILGIILVIIIVGAIWYGVTKKFTIKPLPETKQPIKIGVIAPLTGEMSNWGESMKGGIEIAVEERNNIRGIREKSIKIILEDNKTCDSKETVSALRKLIDVDGVKMVMIGCSGATLAAAPIAEEAEVILLTPMASAAKISEAGDFIFRTCISDRLQGKILGRYTLEKLDFRKIGIIYVNNDYGVGLFDNLKVSFEGLGGEIVQTEKYEFGETDFRTNLTKIKAQSPEALLIIAYGREGGLIARQAKELNMEIQLIGTDNFGTQEVVETGKEAVEGVIFTTSVLDENNPEVKKLKEKFEQKYAKKPSILIEVADAYDATNILLNAIEANGYNSYGIKDYLYSVKDYPGVSGIITIDEKGDAEKSIGIQIIKNGRFVPYDENK